MPTMPNKKINRFFTPSAAKWFYPLCLSVLVVLGGIYATTGKLEGWLYLTLAVLFFFAVRPTSLAHKPKIEGCPWIKIPCTVIVVILTVLACTAPMDKRPLWNGEKAQWRDQYEIMAESILEGRIDIDCCEAEQIKELDNPYDRTERQEAGVDFFHKDSNGESHAHWDHAYYNGHFYMYFGIVPVFLAFLPYRIITGQPLTTYRATQFFVMLAIIGIFLLFYRLSKTFFKKMPYLVYLICSVAFSIMSVWYSAAEPALYCTPIVAAIAMEIWSIYFFVWAVYGSKRENRQILLATIGALFGALAFGCRPPIAIANVAVIPMLVTFLRQRKFTGKLFGKLVLAALPYVIIGVLLMMYNYARFSNPFEFGQAYQLTVTDQSNYSITLNKETLLRMINEGMNSFFSIKSFKNELPYLDAGGVFFNFPMLLLCALIFYAPVRKILREKSILGIVIALLITVVLITMLDILWSPYLLERYHMDIYFLLGISLFFLLGAWLDACGEKAQGRLCTVILTFAVCTILSANLLFIDTVGIKDLPLIQQ